VKMDIIEIKYMPDKWKVLVSCILLNRTRKSQVIPVIEELFKHYPTPEAMAKGRKSKVVSIINTLGFQNQRAKKLILFSRDVVDRGVNRETVMGLHGVGQYAADAYNILFEDIRENKSNDHALKNFLDYEMEEFKACPDCGGNLSFSICSKCYWKESPYSLSRRTTRRGEENGNGYSCQRGV